MNRLRILAGTAGVAAVGAITAKVVSERRRAARRTEQLEDVPFGSVHSASRSVFTDDGLRLNVEIDEGDVPTSPTIIFVHGWLCTLDVWHFQRLALRDEFRMVFYDQRSHGASERSAPAASTVRQLALDLRSVIDATAPDGEIVLVGHSMGGMAIMSLAEEFPELFGDRIVGVALLSTGSRRLMRGSGALVRLAPLLGRTAHLADLARSVNSFSLLKRFGLGPRAREEYADMTAQMIAGHRSHVLLDFYASVLELDVFDALKGLSSVRTLLVGGTKDLMTPIRHVREIAGAVEGSELIEFPEAGHMLMFEEHAALSARIEELARS